MTTRPPSTTSIRPAANIAIANVDGSRLAENIIHFGRLLRSAGLRVGPERSRLAVEAVMAAGLDDPRRLYWTLHAVFVMRRADRDIFNQAFVMFWKDPGYLDQMMSLIVPNFKSGVEADDKALSRRLSEALFKNSGGAKPPEEDEIEVEARGTFSAIDTFQSRDFEQMSASEIAQARRAIAGMQLPHDRLLTRRFKPSSIGRRLDLKAVLRETAARGADHLRPKWKSRRIRRPPLVVLVDISGSMDTYARILLHFVHAVTSDRDRVSVFLFGTRLTNITRMLRHRDPDTAISDVGRQVSDWSGGTRIGVALQEFNRVWARRVLGQNATVLLISDGLDRESGEGMDQAVRRLAANSRRLIWLNPLMRYDAYEPIASGAAILARHVDEQRACHNLASLAELSKSLSGGRR